jgi:hypothetical protein
MVYAVLWSFTVSYSGKTVRICGMWQKLQDREPGSKLEFCRELNLVVSLPVLIMNLRMSQNPSQSGSQESILQYGPKGIGALAHISRQSLIVHVYTFSTICSRVPSTVVPLAKMMERSHHVCVCWDFALASRWLEDLPLAKSTQT